MPLLAQKLQNKVFPKIILLNFNSLCCYKISQKFNLLTFKRTWKTLFWASFDLKALKKGLAPKKSFRSILKLDATVTLCKKSKQIMGETFSRNLKNIILGLFVAPSARKAQNKIFPQKIFRSGLRLYVAVTSCKKKKRKKERSRNTPRVYSL